MQSLDDLIDECIERKQGNKEFALFYMDTADKGWIAMIGCKYGGMMLGESSGEIEADGDTRMEAVLGLLKEIEKVK